jgi:hypothetical protein
MKEPRQNENDRATQVSAKRARIDRGEGAMSPSIRQLILSFGVADSDPTWDADAYIRRSVPAARETRLEGVGDSRRDGKR